MGEYVGVPYSEWLGYVNAAREKGLRCEEFICLQHCFPILGGSSSEIMIQNELAKLEKVLIKRVMDRFQNAVNQCLEDIDLEIAKKALRDLKKSIRDCYFFAGISGYPLSVRRDLAMQMDENFCTFIDEFSGFVKRFTENENSYFSQDFEQIYKRGKLIKFIQECKVYG